MPEASLSSLSVLAIAHLNCNLTGECDYVYNVDRFLSLEHEIKQTHS